MKQIVGDDPAVTSPPDSFRAHDCAAAADGEFEQTIQTRPKLGRQGIVSVIVEAPIGPKAVNIGGDGFRCFSQSAQFRKSLVADLTGGESSREDIALLLRISARPGTAADKNGKT